MTLLNWNHEGRNTSHFRRHSPWNASFPLAPLTWLCQLLRDFLRRLWGDLDWLLRNRGRFPYGNASRFFRMRPLRWHGWSRRRIRCGRDRRRCFGWGLLAHGKAPCASMEPSAQHTRRFPSKNTPLSFAHRCAASGACAFDMILLEIAGFLPILRR